MDPLDAVRPEFGRVAGFKFPLARSARDLVARLAELDIPVPDQAQMCTLVVLPLRDPRAVEDVGRAIDGLVGSGGTEPGQAELAVLFLAGVARVVVIDHVRGLRWAFSRSFTRTDASIGVATVSSLAPGDVASTRRFWVMQRDVLACAAPVAAERRAPDDPLPVTVALPMPASGSSGPLGPTGRFCLGLPTQQPTGLPAHVDARFFGTISRTGLDFALPYNDLLLGVATEVFGDLLAQLRASSELEDHRAATLALHRTTGVLGDRVFAPSGVADGDVVLAWGGKRFVRRSECRLPSTAERALLPFLRDSLPERPSLLSQLPEEQLLAVASAVLESIELPALEASPHPWLDRQAAAQSALEAAARRHRHEGPEYWEPFVASLLRCFDVKDLQGQSWLPVGGAELAAPSERVFLPAPLDTQGDEEEVANVPPRVAAMIRLLDGSAMRLREDGRALTKLALRLAETGLVRRPRKTELLQVALFPALESASKTHGELAFELFGQAISWIASMREASRRKLDYRQARVPLASQTTGEVSWDRAGRSYLGDGWGLAAEHDRLLEAAYPGRRLLPFSTLREKLSLSTADAANWRAAVEAMGVRAVPRVIEFPDRRAPLLSYHRRLLVAGTPQLGRPALEPIYQQYVRFLSSFSTEWIHRLPHDVGRVYWIDGLEEAARRQAIVDLVLMHPEVFLPHATVSLSRVGYAALHAVPSMWAFALAKLDWPVIPAERGVAREPARVPANQVWRLPEGARRAGYAQVITVVPYAFSGASRLLSALGVPSVEDAPLERLFAGLSVPEQACRGSQPRSWSRSLADGARRPTESVIA